MALKKRIHKCYKEIPNIKFLPLQNFSELSDWLNTGDIHIIPQNEEVEEILFHPKWFLFLNWKSIVSNVKEESELGKIVDKVGVRVDPKDQIGLSKH